MQSNKRRPARIIAAGIALCIGCCGFIGLSSRPASATDSCGATRPPPQVQTSGDESGIGGTGIGEKPRDQLDVFVASGDDSESGIGGTGIFGTVTRLNRLCVNGLEIRLPQQLEGQHLDQQHQQQQQLGAHAGGGGERLAVGKIVWIQAMDSESGLVATAIEIHPGWSGEIEQVAANGRELLIRGQVVELAGDTEHGLGLPGRRLAVGQSVVVHGLHDDQDRLIASRIEIATERTLANNVAEPVGRPAQWAAKRMARNDAPRSVSIEGYLREDAARLFLTGMRMELASSLPRPEMQALRLGSRIMVEGRITRQGVLRVDRSRSLRSSDRPTPSRRLAPPTPPRDANPREHLPPKHRPHRVDRPERRPAPTPEKPPVLDRLRR